METSSTPSIRVSQHQNNQSFAAYSSPSLCPQSPASPTCISRTARDTQIPPPLPPPLHIVEEDSNMDDQKEWQLFDKGYNMDMSTNPGPDLHGKSDQKVNIGLEDEEHARSGARDAAAQKSSTFYTLVSTPRRDRKGMSISISPGELEDASFRPSSYSLQSERQLEQASLNDSSHRYDRNLLSKIGGPNTPNRLSISSRSPGGDAPVSPSFDPRAEQSGRLSVSSDRRQSSIDATGTRWAIPTSGAISPGSFRHPIFDPENSRLTAQRHPSLPFDDNPSHRSSSYDQAMFMRGSVSSTDEAQMKDLRINDRSPSLSESYQDESRAGMKRRASSPPRDGVREDRTSISSAPGGSDVYARRALQQISERRTSGPRIAPKHGSVSSVSSYAPRHGSLTSSYGLSVASSATSYASGRISPGNISPAIDPDLSSTPFSASKSIVQRPVSVHQQILQDIQQSSPSHSQTPADSLPQSRQNSIPNVQGLFVCDCCPKKPSKFGSEEELRAHHAEKQYMCIYCPNRFKNKNEAERHQNSLHLRRHSWSCAALPNVESAFHPASNDVGANDVCGYCGEEFPNPADWDKRRNHVTHDHKYSECNQTKKFFRADHFRQHLKHSHAGTSGKWTNLLEIACMRDEPPPQPMADRGSRNNSMSSAQSGSSTPVAAPTSAPGSSSMSAVAAGLSAILGKPGIIDEEPSGV